MDFTKKKRKKTCSLGVRASVSETTLEHAIEHKYVCHDLLPSTYTRSTQSSSTLAQEDTTASPKLSQGRAEPKQDVPHDNRHGKSVRDIFRTKHPSSADAATRPALKNERLP